MYCTRCETEKEEKEFYNASAVGSRKRGKMSWCIKCVKDYYADYREINREREAARKKRWAQANRGHVNKKQCEYYHRRQAV